MLAWAAAGLSVPESGTAPFKPPGERELKRMTARFAPVEIGADFSSLPEAERRALAKLIEAAKVMDGIFLRQVWAGNDALLLELAQDDSALGRARLHAFIVNKGPWSRLDRNASFIPGAPPKPESANFYPPGASKEEVEQWMKGLPEPQRAAANSFFTTIRWATSGEGKFQIVPYSMEFQPELARASGFLHQAAKLTRDATLSEFLERRADAFASNDYYASDVAWMKLDGSIEPTLGPYEVYEDEWFNAKAAFEAFIGVRDAQETEKLARFGAQLQDIEDHLPIEPDLRNPKIGALAPIRVVNELFAAGDANRGVQTAAFNLPNDERITRELGTKRVMLKNVQEAKFKIVLLPIAQLALAPADRKNVAFDAFFTHILMHELMHGLGPHDIVLHGRSTTVRQELRETYSAIEEAKADISGLFALQYLIDKGVIDPAMERTIYATFLASALRSIRFGLAEAHGKGLALQLNYLLDAGAFRADGGTFSVNPAHAKDAVAALTRELMTLQAAGDQQRAKEMLAKLSTIRPEVQKVLDKLSGVPVDIEPRFKVAERLVAESRGGVPPALSGSRR
jgi:hypothetical protein